MQILIVGASGRVGQNLSRILAQAGHQVVGTQSHLGPADLPVLDLMYATVDEIAQKIQQLGDFDAVYFVAGSRGKALLQVDLNGAVKLMTALEQLGIKRYIQLSSYKADRQAEWDGYRGDLTNYQIAKFYADRWLQEKTALDYTILQPGSLIEDDQVTGVEFMTNQAGKNTIATVAQVLADLLQHDNTIHKTITMHQGDQSIAVALGQL